MPITPSALARRRKPVTFSYGDDAVNLEYYPAAINEDTQTALTKLQAQATAAQESQDEAAAQAALDGIGTWLCSLIASWDYLEDDGVTPQPLTPENMAAQLARFPDFLAACVSAVMEDRNRGNANGTPTSVSSGASSSPTVVSPTAGTDAAPSPSMQASPTPSESSLSPVGSTDPPVSNG